MQWLSLTSNLSSKYSKSALRLTLLSLAVILFTFPALAEETTAVETTEDDGDPIEPVNRAIFSFNDTIDEYILEPVAIGYDYVLPAPAKVGVSNFFDNLHGPLYIISSLLQLKITQTGEQTGRFLINTTAGIGGLIDVAKHVGLPHHQEDLGTFLGYWGVGSGPYIVLPFIGPSNVRDTFTRVGDRFLNPMYYVDNVPVSIGATALEVIDTRRQLLDAVDAGKKGSLDYYLFVRNSYRQRRESLINDGVLEDRSPADIDPLDDPSVEKAPK